MPAERDGSKLLYWCCSYEIVVQDVCDNKYSDIFAQELSQFFVLMSNISINGDSGEYET